MPIIHSSDGFSPTAQAGQLNLDFLPSFALYESQEEGKRPLGWELSPIPFALSQTQLQDIQRLGLALWRFIQALDTLYKESIKHQRPAWIASLLDQGKPEALIQFARMKRFKAHLPLVIRPDLLMTENGFQLCEIDAVPGGIGFTSALNELYRKSGFSVLEAPDTIPQAFLRMLKTFYQTQTGQTDPQIAIVLSDEAADYRLEMTWLAHTLKSDYPQIDLIHPKQIELVRDKLVFTTEDGEEKPIDLIYRFFELFDLPNIPKMELIQYALKKKWVQCTPPFKPHVEEKLSLALLHHPVLQAFWKEMLGDADFEWLQTLVPRTWVLDPTPLPPQAIIPGLQPKGAPIQSFDVLNHLSQQERQLVIKPSGFSPLAWGSRGVTIGHDESQSVWQERLNEALSAFHTTPHLLQEFQNTQVQTLERLDFATGEITQFKARTRLCPYYFIQDDRPELSGILATACPADKKIIHGMKDAILAPCMAV